MDKAPHRLVPLVLVLGIFALTAASCGGDDDDDSSPDPTPTSTPGPTPTTTPDFVGEEVGTVESEFTGPGQSCTFLEIRGSTVTGTFENRFVDPQFDGTGTFAGTISGDTVTVRTNPDQEGACDTINTGTIKPAGGSSGTFETVPECPVHVTGTFDSNPGTCPF